MREKAFYVFIASFVLGVAFHSFFDFGFAFSLFLFGLSVTLFILYLIKGRKQSILIVLVSILALSLGLLRFDIATLNKGDPFLDTLIGVEITYEGVVADEPDERENSTRLIVELEKAGEERVRGKALVITERFPIFSYGDRLELKGNLEKPENFVNEQGNVFNYISYLGKDAIYYLLTFPEVERVGIGAGNSVKRTLFATKEKYLDSVERLIPDPEVSLLGGLVVGAKQSLGSELQDKFRKTGIIHIVVLSGYNVTIIAEAIMRVLAFLPKVASLSIGGITILLFALMTGASATIVRASIMAVLVLLARATGRTVLITRILFIAGFFMVLHNPKIVIFDPSFQLSFLATIGLIHLAPFIEKYFRLVPTKWKLREFATATIATQIFVLPLLLYMMGELSIVALPVNILILAFIPLTMLFGFLAGVIGWLSTTIALPFAYIAHGLLSYELFVVDIFSRLPFASISIEHFPIWLMILFYVFYGFILFKISRKNA